MLPDLSFVEGCDARQFCLNLLPHVGPGWYPKVLLAAMLDLGVCRWDHIVLDISARSHVDAATLRRAARGRGAHGQAQRERDDRPVGVQHGGGLQRAQRAGRRGRGLLLRPSPNVGRSASRSGCGRWRRCATRTARRSAAWKRRSRCWAAGRRAWRRSAPNNGGGTGWTTRQATAWRATPCCSRACRHRKDAPNPDHCCEAARAGRGGAPGVQDALLRAEPGAGGADGRPLGAQARARGQRAKAGLAGVEEITQLDMALWADLACVGLNDVKFLLLGDCRPCWTPGPGAISAPLEHSQLVRDLAGHELTRTCAPTPASSTL